LAFHPDRRREQPRQHNPGAGIHQRVRPVDVHEVAANEPPGLGCQRGSPVLEQRRDRRHRLQQQDQRSAGERCQQRSRRTVPGKPQDHPPMMPRHGFACFDARLAPPSAREAGFV
jgi:hypothetical protein